MNRDSVIDFVRRLDAGKKVEVSFIAPALSTAIASLAQRSPEKVSKISFKSECERYAETVDLTRILKHPTSPPPTSYPISTLQRDYSPVRKLFVDGRALSDSLIGDLLQQKLNQHTDEDRQQINAVIGELHLNVNSHSNGVGHSAAQVYNRGRDGQQVEIAVVDSGDGLLRRVQGKDPSITTDARAIEWCLVDGNTTRGLMAQRLPPDCTTSPLPDGADVCVGEQYGHRGRGLYLLVEFIKANGGSLWIWTGNGEYLLQNGSAVCRHTPVRWNGLVVEIALSVTPGKPIANPLKPSNTVTDTTIRELGLS